MPERTRDLPRKLTLIDAAVIVIGIVIGSGIFLLPNLIARHLPSVPLIIAIWVIAGILSLFGALAFAELGAMMPRTGGQYIYLREAWGPGCAFLSGWVFMLAVIPGGIAFLSVGFSLYLAHFTPLTPVARTGTSIALVTILSAINYIGVREGAWIQRIFTAAKIGGLLLIIAAALLYTGHSSTPAFTPATPPYSYTGIGFVMAACLMAYNGWSYVCYVAGEVTNPGRTIPRALALGMGAVMALYLSANLAYFKVMSLSEIASAERVGAALALRVIGPAGANILSAVVLLSVIGAINGCILTGARLPFAQAHDGLFFAQFGRIHPKFHTPGFAIAVQAIWTAIVIAAGSYETLSEYSMLSAWLFYSLAVAAVLVLRRTHPDIPRPYRMWGYPATVYLFLAVSAWFMIDAAITQPGAIAHNLCHSSSWRPVLLPLATPLTHDSN